jgi:hypothetical protein
MYGIEEHNDYEAGAAYGDPRRCPRHPHVATSSGDGMFDGLCHICEGEGEQEAQEAAWEAELARELAEQAEDERFANLELTAGWQVCGEPNVWGGR